MGRLLTVFAAFTAALLLGLLSFLVVEFVQTTEATFLAYFRGFAAIFSPLPILIFVAYLFISSQRDINSDPDAPRPIRISIALFAAAAIGTPQLLSWLETLFAGSDSAMLTAILCNSWLFSLSVLNFTLLRSLPFAALLSGLSLGMTTFLIFFQI